MNPYLSFDGNCEQALEFYKELFKGEIKTLQRFVESPIEVPPDYQEKILHSVLDFDGMTIMAGDSMPNQKPTRGSNISLSLNVKNVSRAEQLFNALAEGGKIEMPLQETFWNSLFGTLTDKFGIPWMINCELPKN